MQIALNFTHTHTRTRKSPRTYLRLYLHRYVSNYLYAINIFLHIYWYIALLMSKYNIHQLNSCYPSFLKHTLLGPMQEIVRAT